MMKTFALSIATVGLLCLFAAIGLSAQQPSAQAPALAGGPSFEGVFTYHNDNARTGQNLAEKLLKHSNVKSPTFRRLFSDSVDGQIYAQPLYFPGVSIPGQGTHNVVYIATENDSVYAFDADNAGPPLWHAILRSTGITAVPASTTGCDQITPKLGITGTPVIDRQSRVIYLVAMTRENGTDVHRLHALAITTGLERPHSPVVLQASMPVAVGRFSSNPYSRRSVLDFS